LRAERQELAERLTALQERHEQTERDLEGRNAALNQIQNSQGWKLLSACYRLRDKIIPKIIREGAGLLRDMRLVAASRQFDEKWYLQRNRDVAQARVPALRHYLRRGAWEGRDPNPFFDSDWYLRQNPDVAESGANPLVHYLRHGADEGRAPSPFLDSDAYLKQYDDPANPRKRPTLPAARGASAEVDRLDADRNLPSTRLPIAPRLDWPSPSMTASSGYAQPGAGRLSKGIGLKDGQRPKLRTRRISSLVHPKRPAESAGKGRLLCMTHVLPYPPRAGNEYRTHRMLDWLAANGFEIFLLVCPLQQGEITLEQLGPACSAYSNLIFCERDGTVWYQLAQGDGPMKGLDGVRPRPLAELLREDDHSSSVSPRLLPILRTFCPDAMGEVALHLDAALQPEIILAEYVFMTRVLPLVHKGALRVVDTHDVFSTRHDKTVQFGVEDALALTAKEEASLLDRADLVIAIQSEEAIELRRLAPNRSVITAGVDFEPVKTVPALVPDPIVLAIGSGNAANVKGLRDFLRFAWPIVRREVPNAELRVAGAVGLQVEVDDPSVKILGLVNDLSTAYADARIVINPTIAGTGLKVKTIEALCHLRPLVTWPSGVEGIEADMQSLCYVATDWYMFARHVIDLCQRDSAGERLIDKREDIIRKFSSNTTYATLKTALHSMQQRRNS